MRNFKVILSYDGTNYNGWQVQTKQPHVRTLQGTVEAALKKVFKTDKCRVTAAGRTDAGVHARGQVINFYADSTIPVFRVPYALNSVLPEDIVAIKCEEVDKDFHARYSAKKKWYRYIIYNSQFPAVFMRNYAWFVGEGLRIEAMKQAARYFKGTYDFTSFVSAGTSVRDFTRTVKTCRLSTKNKYIFLDITADGFLYNMVRIIAGTIIQVGRGKIAPYEIRRIIEAKDRRQAGPTAPACGLYLMKVFY